MLGLIYSIQDFLQTDNKEIMSNLKTTYPQAQAGQIQAWDSLLKDLKECTTISKLPPTMIMAIEYSLATDGMAIDLLFAGNYHQQKSVVLVEAKQWNDQYIENAQFSNYREDGKELHPQIQVNRHKLSFKDYLNIGETYMVYPCVYVKNASTHGCEVLKSKNPLDVTKSIPVFNSMQATIEFVNSHFEEGNIIIAKELEQAEYRPSKSIIQAMKSIISREEPFILTKEQKDVIKEIKESIDKGKKIISITGAAGSGKTAILLNLYLEFLNEKTKKECRPIFVSGAQNTALYRSIYREVERSFTYSFSLDKMVAKTKGNLYVILMDEAQHNQQGIITNMVARGATLILCYDANQTINEDNALKELEKLEQREDFKAINLRNSVRFNGSQVAERNIISCLQGKRDFLADPLYEFKFFDDFQEFQHKIIKTIQEHPQDTLAVTGLLSSDAKNYTVEENPTSILFTKWENKTECKWIPYVRQKNYLTQNDKKIWVGTWWMPGLDVDYIAVIVGGDAKMTSKGLVANPQKAKHYRMILSIAKKLHFPESLFVNKKIFGKVRMDTVKTTANILEYLDLPERKELKNQFLESFSKLLYNNYYIMLSRGRKGCFVYFSNSVK